MVLPCAKVDESGAQPQKLAHAKDGLNPSSLIKIDLVAISSSICFPTNTGLGKEVPASAQRKATRAGRLRPFDPAKTSLNDGIQLPG